VKRRNVDRRNPKDVIGQTKAPLALWPAVATLVGSLALFDGKEKYGRTNWRATPVLATIYVEAAMRHLALWYEGEDRASDSKVHHLGHVLACIAILVDAYYEGTLVDDRQYSNRGYERALQELTPLVRELTERHQDKHPKHWTRADQEAAKAPRRQPRPPREGSWWQVQCPGCGSRSWVLEKKVLRCADCGKRRPREKK